MQRDGKQPSYHGRGASHLLATSQFCPSDVRPSHASDFLKTGKPQKLLTNLVET